MSDSARWCQICEAHGDHHTDRHIQMGSKVVRVPDYAITYETWRARILTHAPHLTDLQIHNLWTEIQAKAENLRKKEVRKPSGRNLDPGPCLPGACTYGTCQRTWSDPHGCGGCCECLGGCRASDEDKVVRHQYKVSDRRLVRLLTVRNS